MSGLEGGQRQRVELVKKKPGRFVRLLIAALSVKRKGGAEAEGGACEKKKKCRGGLSHYCCEFYLGGGRRRRVELVEKTMPGEIVQLLIAGFILGGTEAEGRARVEKEARENCPITNCVSVLREGRRRRL
jgi:hypothetical protein